jgi:hypothetical protein
MSEAQVASFSNLMELATLDTSDLKAQTSRLPNQGIYVINIEELKFAEQAPSDPADPMNYTLTIRGTVLAFQPLDQNGASEEDMEGRQLTERYFLYGKQIQEAIQLLMGRFKLVGFRHKGIMGGVEGSEPGWIDEAVGQRVCVRVRHYTSRGDGQERASFDWLSPKQMEKAGIQWEVLARPFLDENGNEVGQEAA